LVSADYFSQNLLVKYVNQHPEETAGWKITASFTSTHFLRRVDVTDYKTRAKAAFEALLAVRGEDGALAAVAALY
jgi:hypothetical protein